MQQKLDEVPQRLLVFALLVITQFQNIFQAMVGFYTSLIGRHKQDWDAEPIDRSSSLDSILQSIVGAPCNSLQKWFQVIGFGSGACKK